MVMVVGKEELYDSDGGGEEGRSGDGAGERG